MFFWVLSTSVIQQGINCFTNKQISYFCKCHLIKDLDAKGNLSTCVFKPHYESEQQGKPFSQMPISICKAEVLGCGSPGENSALFQGFSDSFSSSTEQITPQPITAKSSCFHFVYVLLPQVPLIVTEKNQNYQRWNDRKLLEKVSETFSHLL